MHSKQETFDKVAKFLLEQDGPSLHINPRIKCAYRSDDGKKCAAGCLIPDNEYDPRMDIPCNVSGTAANKHPLVLNCLLKNGYDPDFVQCLQNIHDIYSDRWDYWESEMINFARNNNLSTSVFGV